ncbi:unnamed protein product, partial [Discosporangium mesarthrocarpum]
SVSEAYRNSVINELESIYSDFNIDFSDKKSEFLGEYSTIFISDKASKEFFTNRGWNWTLQKSSDLVGNAHRDVGNKYKNDNAYVFHEPLSTYSDPKNALIEAIAHEVGHILGAGHSKDSNSVFYGGNTGNIGTIQDEEFMYLARVLGLKNNQIAYFDLDNANT